MINRKEMEHQYLLPGSKCMNNPLSTAISPIILDVDSDSAFLGDQIADFFDFATLVAMF